MRAQDSRVLRGLHGGADALDGQRVFRAYVDVAFVRADGHRGDHHAFDDGVWVALHDRAVHERAGVALVAVADDVFFIAFTLAGQIPFAARGEAAAAPALEAGIHHQAANCLGRHVRSFFCLRVSAHGDIFVDVGRVDIADLFQHNVVLIPVKWHLVFNGIGLLVGLVGVDQAVDNRVAQNALFNDLFHVLRRHLAVHDTRGLDGDDRAHLAKSLAAAAGDLVAVLMLLDIQCYKAGFSLV